MKVTKGMGQGVGKKGQSVFYVNHGVQIEREYTSSVHNPNTVGQVAQRLRFKLASQVSSALEPAIVMPRVKLQSPRNRFVKANMGFFYSDGVTAQVTYEALQLTAGSAPLPPLVIERELGVLVMKFDAEPASNISRVVYIIYNVVEGGQLAYRISTIQNDRDTRDGWFKQSVAGIVGDIVVYAYGIFDRSVKATSKYNNYRVNDALQLATLFSTNALRVADYGFTRTMGVLLDAGSSTNPQPDPGQFSLSLLAQWGQKIAYTIGSVEHEGVQSAFVFVTGGTSVQIETTPEPGFNFIGWCKNGVQTPFSTSPSITFSMEENLSIVAKYQAIEVIANADTIHGLE